MKRLEELDTINKWADNMRELVGHACFRVDSKLKGGHEIQSFILGVLTRDGVHQNQKETYETVLKQIQDNRGIKEKQIIHGPSEKWHFWDPFNLETRIRKHLNRVIDKGRNFLMDGDISTTRVADIFMTQAVARMGEREDVDKALNYVLALQSELDPTPKDKPRYFCGLALGRGDGEKMNYPHPPHIPSSGSSTIH